MKNTSLTTLLAMLCLSFTSACLERTLVPLNPCLVSGVTVSVAVNNIDKVDLLFMVDNSSSMEDKQKNLREHVPQLVQALVTGKRNDTDPNPFPPVKDLHIGVVDCDMGLPGVTGVPGCNGYGDDGLFQHTPHPSPESPNCAPSYPTFLSYNASMPNGQTPATLSQDFGCIANVGAMGCGFEQQLEALLKSVWPSIYTDAKGNVVTTNPITFLSDGGPERLGHGDMQNAGFLRTDPTKGLSLLAIILLSDEDDGSTGQMELYTPKSRLPANTWVDPSTFDDLNLRPLIGANRDHLFPVKRYIDGFKALRPGNENLVVFAAITGVPLDLVDGNAKAGVDFTNGAQRDAYYDAILADPRMQNVPDNAASPAKMVKPACLTSFGHGYPGRRYVELAKGMGENATVYSICESDYTPALNNIIDIIAKQLRTVCLPRALVRNDGGKVNCNVVWELPTQAARTTLETPIECSERPYLQAPAPDHTQLTASGGQICTVNQVAVVNNMLSDGDGWFYDNFSTDLKNACSANTPQRVAFTPNAKPPSGVVVKLECYNETQRVAEMRTSVIPGPYGIPTIGSSCEQSVAGGKGGTSVDQDELCAVWLSDATVDRSMFCDPKSNTCVKSCQSSNDCPPAWDCDTRPATFQANITAKHPQGSAVCVNPTCGGAD